VIRAVMRLVAWRTSTAALAPSLPCEAAMIDLDAQIKAAMKSKDAAALNAYRSLKTKAMVKLNEVVRGA